MNILLPVDQSDASEKAVHFVGELLGRRLGEGDTVTILHVVESLPDDFLMGGVGPETSDTFKQAAEHWDADRSAAGERLLAKLKQTLLDAGMDSSAVENKLVVRESRPNAGKVIAALAIIEEMKQGPYAVVCLGRRGVSAAAGSFPGSVAEKVIREAFGKTVWVVD